MQGAVMEPERLLLIFERSPEESQLQGVGEAIRALERNDIDVKVVAQSPAADGLIAGMLRFWFPYLWTAGIVGVTPGEALGQGAEVGAFNVTLAPELGPAFGKILAGWLETQQGRKIRVKFDEIEIEARTPEQFESLLLRLGASRQNWKLARSGGR
jgi:hypothetical protein